MKRKSTRPSHPYPVALLRYLRRKPGGVGSARRQAFKALAVRIRSADLAWLHERFLVMRALPACPPGERAALNRQAAEFFALTVSPPGPALPGTRQADVVRDSIEVLIQRTVDLSAQNQDLSREITRREGVEAALKRDEQRYQRLLEHAKHQQSELRRLSRQLLSAQEDERRMISRELHDVIAQTLTGITLRLASLKTDADRNTKGLVGSIANTQRLVERSVDLVHRFACDLRPAVLDDLGLIPALKSFIKRLSVRTGLRIRLIACAEVENLDMARQTVFFRVVQEALHNVARHAKARRVQVDIRREDAGFRLRITDDGVSFDVKSAFLVRRRRRLGLLGMRERLEMVGGRFAVESAPGKGTTVTARIPCRKKMAAQTRARTTAGKP